MKGKKEKRDPLSDFLILVRVKSVIFLRGGRGETKRGERLRRKENTAVSFRL